MLGSSHPRPEAEGSCSKVNLLLHEEVTHTELRAASLALRSTELHVRFLLPTRLLYNGCPTTQSFNTHSRQGVGGRNKFLAVAVAIAVQLLLLLL